MTNFLNYVHDRLDKSIQCIMKNEKLIKFDKHPFEE